MLIEFSVTNYRSISERQTLNLAASAAYSELETTNTITTNFETGAPKLLRSIALYGPNASGKTTLIRALDFMQNCVFHSAKESQVGELIETVPFKLTEKSRNAPSEFEITFVEGGLRYEYGFACNASRFTEEWLHAYPNERPQKWFHRLLDESGNDVYKFGPKFEKALRKSFELLTTPNSLFLSRASQLNSQQLKPVFDWFKETLRIVELHELSHVFSSLSCTNADKAPRILDFLKAADLSISDIKIESQDFNEANLPDGMSGEIKDRITKQMRGKSVLEPKFLHLSANANEETVKFDSDEESDGTQALYALAGPWIDVLDNNKVLVIDELDRSLHPLIVRQLVEQFHHTKSSAQLIFTTHDTTILSQKILRRDQVWLTEKNQGAATRLYPLSDFSIRENEAIEKGYLSGRYGGIPILRSLDFYEIK